MKTSAQDHLLIGVDIGRTTRAALIDSRGNILLKSRDITNTRSAQALIDQLIEIIRRIQSSEPAGGAVAAAGIGFPGLTNMRTHRIEAMPNLTDISDIDIYQEITEATGIPVIFDNDANVAAYGEWRIGAGRGYRDMFYITMGTGVGSGLILNGQFYHGCKGFAGEFGHITVDPIEGIECGCGNTGCLETIVSGPNMVRRVREFVLRDNAYASSALTMQRGDELNCDSIFRAAAEGDNLAKIIIQQTAQYLGIAIAAMINVLNIEAVVIGGGVMSAGELLLKPIIEETRRRAFAPSYACCNIVAGALKEDAGIIGAAMLARDMLAGERLHPGIGQ